MEILNKINNSYYSSIVDLHKRGVVGVNEPWSPIKVDKAKWATILKSDFKSPSYKEATLRSLFDGTAFTPIKASISKEFLTIETYFKENLTPVIFTRHLMD